MIESVKSPIDEGCDGICRPGGAAGKSRGPPDPSRSGRPSYVSVYTWAS